MIRNCLAAGSRFAVLQPFTVASRGRLHNTGSVPPSCLCRATSRRTLDHGGHGFRSPRAPRGGVPWETFGINLMRGRRYTRRNTWSRQTAVLFPESPTRPLTANGVLGSKSITLRPFAAELAFPSCSFGRRARTYCQPFGWWSDYRQEGASSSDFFLRAAFLPSVVDFCPPSQASRTYQGKKRYKCSQR